MCDYQLYFGFHKRFHGMPCQTHSPSVPPNGPGVKNAFILPVSQTKKKSKENIESFVEVDFYPYFSEGLIHYIPLVILKV